MTSKVKQPVNAVELRKLAEEIAREQAVQHQEDIETLSPEEIREKLNELHVHQIELDMQNEELRRTQAELTDSQARYFDLYTLAPVGYMTISENGLILETNLTAATLLNITRDVLVNQPITRFIHKEDQDIYYLHRKKLLETTEPQTCELRMMKRDGTVFWTNLSGTNASDNVGAPVCRVVISDITARKRAEKVLQDSEANMRYIVKHDPNAIAVYDRTLHYVAVSDRYIQDYDVKEEDIIGKHHYEVFPEMPQKWKDVHQRCLAGAIERNDDDWFERLDGSITHNRWECRPWRQVNGEIEGIITYSEVTTERKKAEDNLRRSEARLTSLVENLLDALIVTDQKGTILFVNPAACKLFGRENAHLVGSELGFPITMNKTFEIDVIKPDSDIHHVEAKITDTDWNNQPAHLISLRDITERVIALKEREQMNAHLQQLQKIEAIGTLAGGIAHDFNNILSPIYGYTELAIGMINNEPVIETCLKQVLQSAERAKDLVRQILTFSRQSKTEFQPLLVGAIVKEVLKLIRATLPATIEIRQHIASERIILGDATQIHQILMNLCTNAKHAMEASGGVLNVSLEDVSLSPDFSDNVPDLHPGAYIRLRVADTGQGMDRSVMDKIFQPYFTTKSTDKGTGLGLAVVHGIVKDHGGAITVESEVGKGTVFDVYLPGSNVEKILDHDKIREPEKGDEHILVVDDEPVIVKLNQHILEGLGYQITSCTSSIEALELFKSKPEEFDLIVSDMTMPIMTGDNLASACIRIRPDIPIILLTGFSEKITEETAQKLGIKALLLKPVRRFDLAKTIRKALDENGEKGKTR